MSSVQVEVIGTDSKEIPFQDASLDIWDKKYRLRSNTGEIIDKTIDETYQRVARALSEAETLMKTGKNGIHRSFGLFAAVPFRREG